MAKPTPDQLDAAGLKRAAADLLSKREHSRLELTQKLTPKAQRFDDLERVLDALVADGWQSDERFTDVFIRSRISRGLGPMRIRQELKQRGIHSDLYQTPLESHADWFELACRMAEKKSASLDLTDLKHKAKLYRFLAYKGFQSDAVQYAIEHCQRLQRGDD